MKRLFLKASLLSFFLVSSLSAESIHTITKKECVESNVLELFSNPCARYNEVSFVKVERLIDLFNMVNKAYENYKSETDADEVGENVDRLLADINYTLKNGIEARIVERSCLQLSFDFNANQDLDALFRELNDIKVFMEFKEGTVDNKYGDANSPDDLAVNSKLCEAENYLNQAKSVLVFENILIKLGKVQQQVHSELLLLRKSSGRNKINSDTTESAQDLLNFIDKYVGKVKCTEPNTSNLTLADLANASANLYNILKEENFNLDDKDNICSVQESLVIAAEFPSKTTLDIVRDLLPVSSVAPMR